MPTRTTKAELTPPPPLVEAEEWTEPEVLSEPEPLPEPDRIHEPEPALADEPARTSMEEAILAEELHPERASEAAAVSEQAEAMFDDSWQELTTNVPSRPDSLPSRKLTIESVGEARRAGDLAVVVPVVLRDETDRRFSLALTVRLDFLDDVDSS